MKSREPETASEEGACQRNVVERLKAELLEELRLWTPEATAAYRKQVGWEKPNPVEMAKKEARPGSPTPMAFALSQLPPELVTEASRVPDSFGCLLDAVDVTAWGDYCTKHGWPWMTRVWLAAASQLRAERRLIHKAHGLGNTREELRRDPNEQTATEFFFAQLRHANEKRRTELLTIPGLEDGLKIAQQNGDEALLRRFRRAKKGAGKRAGTSPAEKFMVRYWLEMPSEVPGLCFFSDSALHALLSLLSLSKNSKEAIKQLRVRLGLIQAGAKRHLVEKTRASGKTVSLLAFADGRERMLRTFDSFFWAGKKRWPR